MERPSILLLMLLVLFQPVFAGSYNPLQSLGVPKADLPKHRTDAEKRSYFTDLKLTTHEGKEIRFYSDLLKDRVVLITFYYTDCAPVCPLQNKVLYDLQPMLGEHLGKEILLMSITVDPLNDKPEIVKQYAEVWRPKKGRIFLTGKKENIDWVNYRLGGYVEDRESHMTTYLLGNVRTGHWMKIKPDATARGLASYLYDLLEENG